MELSQLQLDCLRALAESGQPLMITELVRRLGSDQSPVTAACVALEQAALVKIQDSEYEEWSLGPESRHYAREMLPERVIVDVLRKSGGSCKLTEIPNHCPLSAAQVGQSLRWLQQRGWAAKQGDLLVLSDAPPAPIDAPQPDELVIRALADGHPARRGALRESGLPVDAAFELLSKRRGFLVVKSRTDRSAALADAGRRLLDTGVTARRRVTQLTPDLMADGGWRAVDFAAYDVKLAARTIHPGKEHPFQRTLDRIRRVFMELGFTEIVSPWIESSFWDFDALFQPQDHPARDMQDTFYVSRPGHCRLPDDALVERVRAAHENGGDTGSTGWQYRWRRELAHKPVLRTHTTAATIRALAAHAAKGKCELRITSNELKAETESRGAGSELAARNSQVATGSRVAHTPPGKYFVIGPVFRRETVDYKHLPVFHQVDGIIVDPHASLSTLLGTLSAFYGKMGFPKIRFRPSFFPYTEPSAEVFLWLESRREWVEMGGSGLFRPEVTLPLGIRDRVLAWGLGLERLAMMIHGLSSIGELYFASMPWLRESPVNRA
ncbi:MAG: phenylalanine--tRNA ligase subunit alpha [Phycisphaerae bacterium]